MPADELPGPSLSRLISPRPGRVRPAFAPPSTMHDEKNTRQNWGRFEIKMDVTV